MDELSRRQEGWTRWEVPSSWSVLSHCRACEARIGGGFLLFGFLRLCCKKASAVVGYGRRGNHFPRPRYRTGHEMLTSSGSSVRWSLSVIPWATLSASAASSLAVFWSWQCLWSSWRFITRLSPPK